MDDLIFQTNQLRASITSNILELGALLKKHFTSDFVIKLFSVKYVLHEWLPKCSDNTTADVKFPETMSSVIH